jgi:hypothetical protein
MAQWLTVFIILFSRILLYILFKGSVLADTYVEYPRRVIASKNKKPSGREGFVECPNYGGAYVSFPFGLGALTSGFGFLFRKPEELPACHRASSLDALLITILL